MDLAARFASLRSRSAPAPIPDDLQLHSAQVLQNEAGELEALLFHAVEREGGREYRGWRAVRLLELRAVPLEARRDAGLLQKMRTILRGLYGAQVDPVYLAAGVFREPCLGVIQCYGVSVFAAGREEALARSARDLGALQAGLAGGYRQLRLAPVAPGLTRWLLQALDEMPHAIVTVGHPDPRENPRGGEGALADPLLRGRKGTDLAAQQNELLFRGMAALQEEFLLLVLAGRVATADLARMLSGLMDETTVQASRQSGNRSASFGAALPAFFSGGVAQNAALSHGTGHTQGEVHGTAETSGQAETAGTAHTVGHAETRGWAYTVGSSSTTSSGSAHTEGSAETNGTAHTEGTAETSGTSESSTSGWAATEGSSSSYGVSSGLFGNLSPAGVGLSASGGGHASWGSSSSVTSSGSSSSGSFHSTTASRSDTVSHSTTASSADTTSTGAAETRSESWTTSGSETESTADTTSRASTASRAQTLSAARSAADSVGTGQALSRGTSAGLSLGVAPSFALSASSAWQDDSAIVLTDILRTQRRLLDTACLEGAYYTDLYALARSEAGAQALLGLIPEAFHGTEDVVSGVRARLLEAPEQAYISLHARAFTPSTRPETLPEAMSGYADATLLTMLQLAAYTAPGVFEQGSALTTQEEIPSFAFYPRMEGDLTLARQWSSETGMLTEAPLRLSRERHFHTAFVGDTGYGKSVAAERLAYETTRGWHYRTIVLDFGQGWRKALNWPGLGPEQRVDIRGLYPGSPRPLVWNILQVPRRVEPGRYRSLLAELFANAGRMGARQLGFLRRALTELYEAHGVLTGDPRLQAGPLGVLLDAGEERLVRGLREAEGTGGSVARRGTPLLELTPAERQALAVHRSRRADVSDWIGRLRAYRDSLGRDQVSRTSLEGVLLRLEPFAEGNLARQYGAGAGTSGVEDLGLLGEPADPWGVSVVEGGAELDEYAKAALLALLAQVLYLDAVARRREALAGTRFPPMQIFFEEANKVLTGVPGGAASDSGAGEGSNPVSFLFQTMWRDGRKYGIFLHLLAQTVSEIPAGILSSCANIFVFQTKDPRDRDLVLPHLGRSEKGLVNTEYKRFLSRIPRSAAVAKLGYSDDFASLEPVLVQPGLLAVAEPSDGEIARRLGGTID